MLSWTGGPEGSRLCDASHGWWIWNLETRTVAILTDMISRCSRPDAFAFMVEESSYASPCAEEPRATNPPARVGKGSLVM
jgi:hypothetical protein